MTKRAAKRHPVLKATIWFCVVMLPSWWLLAFALTGGCEFEPASIKRPKVVVLDRHPDDSDGGK